MLDATTMRIVLATVTGIVLLLFYVGTYRRTGSRYAMWWCFALLASGTSTGLYLFNGTGLQAIANPLGNVFGVVGTGCVWFAARAVRGRAPIWPVEAFLVGVVGLAAFLDHPAHDIWAGGGFLLWGMLVNLALTVGETILLIRERRGATRSAEPDVTTSALRALLVASGGLAVLYAGRIAGYYLLGPFDPRFKEWLGSSVTTLAITVVLVIATFSVSEISHYEVTREIRLRARYDDLTGLLTRAEFLEQADAWRGRRPGAAIVMMADLDHFKALNDALGHAAGDRALLAFGTACRQAVEGRGIAGRIGGEEFAILLHGDDVTSARQVAAEISHRYAHDTPIRLGTPTVSYGVAAAAAQEILSDAIARADRALYRAKRAGRDRFEVDDASDQ
ncbi:GGDEF domain-containing protein [Demequina capsici]|uniref:GGDEF domain-containing protein n=1 Tax=Demequina capsici TaxID=3075620 RepID=A0AA96FF09_9MICO|nr:GGDEF domain-containing protein [Demequina sp. PMTSA13]WNM28803.1 GGDEF domain-containing protein [Demequina sp. PMTSA13]